MNLIQQRAELLSQYDLVFDEHGEILLCGRLQCITLIELCDGFNQKKDIDYGDNNTGMMNVQNIKKLINSLS